MSSPRVTARSFAHAGERGFSLLEVMVATGILGLALTVILSAQAGLASSNRSAANMGTATTIGRCKMSEVEEKLLKLGYSEIDEIESSPNCCEDKETTGFACDWRVEKVVLPTPVSNSDAGLSSLGLSGADGGLGNLSALGLPAPGSSDTPASLNTDGGLGGLGQAVQNGIPGGGASGLIGMVFGLVYPSLKPVMEASIRRLTVTVKWREGYKDREFALVQYVTNPQRAGFAQGFNGPDGGVDFSAPVGSSTPGTTGTGGARTAPTGAVPR